MPLGAETCLGLYEIFAPIGPEVDAGASQSLTLTKGTARRALLGTASYTSPEQTRRQALDRCTDISALED